MLTENCPIQYFSNDNVFMLSNNFYFGLFFLILHTEDGVPRTSRSMSLSVGKVLFQEMKLFNEVSVHNCPLLKIPGARLMT